MRHHIFPGHGPQPFLGAALLLCMLVFVAAAAPCRAADSAPDLASILSANSTANTAPNSARESGTFIFYFENDLFGGTDQFYTNAVRLTAISPDLVNWAESSDLPDSLDELVMSLPFAGDEDALYNVSLSMGQDIYTPSDTQATALQDKDRPYAGFLYGAVGLHAKKGDRLDTLEFTLGVVGPWALGETSQNGVHTLRHLPTAKGWDNQLHNEPGIMATWERTWRGNDSLKNSGWEWDVLPHAGVTVGNVMTYANTGGEVRFGWNLPSDFGTSLIRAGGGVGSPTSDSDPRISEGLGAYVFLGADVRAVGRNIFLDGNTFQQSPHVDKKPIVADLSGGIAFILGRWRIAYTHVLRTEEFYAQEKEQHFGSLQISYSF